MFLYNFYILNISKIEMYNEKSKILKNSNKLFNMYKDAAKFQQNPRLYQSHIKHVFTPTLGACVIPW